METSKWNIKSYDELKGVEIVEYVKKRICQIVDKKNEMKQVEIEELRSIIEALFSKI